MAKLKKRKKTENMLDMSSRSKISFTKDMPEKTWTIDDQSKYLQKKMTNYDGYIKELFTAYADHLDCDIEISCHAQPNHIIAKYEYLRKRNPENVQKRLSLYAEYLDSMKHVKE